MKKIISSNKADISLNNFINKSPFLHSIPTISIYEAALIKLLIPKRANNKNW
jgi:hypothetical protein